MWIKHFMLYCFKDWKFASLPQESDLQYKINLRTDTFSHT
jgi:hypothetical protein